MKGVQCYELFGGIALKNRAFSFHFIYSALNLLVFLIFSPHRFFNESTIKQPLLLCIIHHSRMLTATLFLEHIGLVVRMCLSGYRG